MGLVPSPAATFRYALFALPPLMAAAYPYNRNRGNRDTPRTASITKLGDGAGTAGRKDRAI
ncbi:hypothetical protein E2562_031835 [Oryza meyeriana var. granulata]|uniref:Uncharacterized protein n=1 Tax=Oryza meyeriana var. granulata TaxID=110450 RepID=A0A6G1CVJ3_9ORYZ|nr:hypothetical protein E2562_031835 [Oryza meyeriana var. granulata]